MFEYFAVLRVAASSAAEPASRAAAATYESADGQMTVTSQVSGFPASQGTRERPQPSSSSLQMYTDDSHAVTPTPRSTLHIVARYTVYSTEATRSVQLAQ